jgi:DNA polymerase elongation subunit (family B)
MCANGAVFRKDIEGVLPRAMTYVFDNRKKYKKLMLQEKRNKEKYIEEGGVEGSEEYNRINDLISMYDALQGALKVLANSGYGATANCGFRYFNRSIAEGITLTGQFTIQETIAKVNLFLGKLSGIDRNRMICSDTDSSYFDISDFIEHPNDPSLFVDEMEEFCKTKLAPFIDMVQKNISNRMGCAKNLMDMKREALIGSGFWRGKKNYACLVYDMEDVRYHEPILKTVGIQTKRSDQPMVIRKELEKCILIILQETEEILQKEVVKFKKVYMGLPLHDIAKPIGISNINSTAWNSAAGRRHNQLILDLGLEKEISRIKSGSKVKVLKLKKANPLQANCFAFEGELNPKFGIDKYVDVDVMWTETFTSTLESFTKVIG